MSAIPQIKVWRAQAGDIPELAAVLTPEVSMGQLAQRWQEYEDGHREMLVGVVGGHVAGTVGVGGSRHQRPDSLRMFALDVGPTFRRRGVGAALITAVEEEARARSLQMVHLEVAAENIDAIRLYERLGYRREDDPIIDRWCRLTENGTREEVEDLSYVMVKRL